MPFGLFGPVTYRTKNGSRITFVAGFLTVPLTVWSAYKLLHLGDSPGGDGRSSTAKSTEVDLSGR